MDSVQTRWQRPLTTWPDHVIDSIQAVLLSDSPDIAHLGTQLEADLGLAPGETRTFMYHVVAQLNNKLFPPITKLEVVHTEGCNLACTYCFEKSMLGLRQMTLATARAAVDLLFDYAGDEPRLYITHFGGEPLLNFPAVQYVTEYAEEKAAVLEKSVECGMTSNGLLLTEERAAYLAQHKVQVLLSVDGLEESHDRYRVDRGGRGTFRRVMERLRILKQVQPWIGVKMTVMPSNVPSLYADVRGLYDMGVNQFIIGHATGVAWAGEEMQVFRDQLSRLYQWYNQSPRQDLRISTFEEDEAQGSYFGCRAGRDSISVGVDGAISPCSKVLALNNQALLARLGDVRFGLTHLRNRLELVNCPQLRSACEAQGIADAFAGGCFACNYEENLDLFQPSLQEHAFSLLERSVLRDD
jgi:uncharacterized protein